MTSTLSVVLLAVASIYTVHARSSGAPASSCDNLTPSAGNHGAPQSNPSPYNINLTVFADGMSGYEYVPGQTYTLSIQGNNGETFRGFFVQSRLLADDTTRVGVFATIDDFTRLSLCPVSTDGVTHMNTETPRIDFTERSMSWTAPPVGTGPVRFGYAVVQVRNTHWANERTEVIQEAPPQPQPSSTAVVGPSETPAQTPAPEPIETPSVEPTDVEPTETPSVGPTDVEPTTDPTDTTGPTLETESATGVFVSMVSLLGAVVAGILL